MYDFIIDSLILIILEIILNLDNLVLVAVIINKSQSKKILKFISVLLSFILRIVMLMIFYHLVHITNNIIYSFSVKDILFLLGGIFLFYKGISSIIYLNKKDIIFAKYSLSLDILQILIINLIFSLDSVIVAVGFTDNTYIILISVMVGSLVMLGSVEKLSDLLIKYPNIKVIVFLFIAMLGIFFIFESFDVKIPKQYLYYSISFAILVEISNIYVNKKAKKNSTSDEI
ncbi:MAG: hypothetical protein OEY79_02510 [Anaplasmataceae bacterium]|nr:hypothetical protein [Anaplasmataceae bacterium]